MLKKFLIIVAVGVVPAGCAAGVEHRYRDAGAAFNVETSKSVAVAVHDKRPYVVRGDKPASFVGLSRGGFGNPFEVATDSGLPLADDMASSIVAALKQRGVSASSVAVSPAANDAAARGTLLATNADRLVLLTLYEWKSDTMMNTALHFIVRLRVFDRKGKELASKDLQGRENLGGSALNAPAHSREAVPKAFKSKLEALFNDPAIVAALK